jgi:hypothetical protein
LSGTCFPRLALFLSALTLGGCGDAREPPDVAFLAADAHLLVGGEKLILPFVAISQVSGPLAYQNDAYFERGSGQDIKDQVWQMAGHPEKPLLASSVGVTIRLYGSTGETSKSQAICPLLQRQWSRHVCQGERPGVLRDLPKSFDLTSRSDLTHYSNQFTVGQRREGRAIAAFFRAAIGMHEDFDRLRRLS